MKSCISHSLEETKEIASEWLIDITRRCEESSEAAVVGLSGHLGAGKTAFVKMVGSLLGIEEEITSPTFVIMKIYMTQHPHWKRLVHIDAYRLEKRDELEVLDLEKIVQDPQNLIVLEWPENVQIKKEDVTELLQFEIKNGAHHITLV